MMSGVALPKERKNPADITAINASASHFEFKVASKG
jgi:hypothetical protein